MSLDFELDDAQRAMAGSVAQLCRDHAAALAGQDFPDTAWRALGALGALAVATPEGDGSAVNASAVMEALGAAGFPGPLAAAFLAASLLPPDDPDRDAVTSGRAMVAAGTPPLLPFAPRAALFVWLEGDRAWRARPIGPIEPVDTLGGEPWGRVQLERGAELPGAGAARALAEVAAAAYLGAAGQALVDATAEHVRTRKQFGRALGEFQAVAHPLADCAIRLAAAGTLARVAAAGLDASGLGVGGRVSDTEARRARVDAAVARLSAGAAALRAAEVCTQAFGAMGVLREGPAWPLVRRIRQAASSPPDDGAARATVLGELGLPRARSAA